LLTQLKARNLFCFHPWNREPNLLSTFDSLSSETSLALPIVKPDDEEMDFYPWSPGDSLVANAYGIAEPVIDQCSVPLSPDENTVILVPALAVDRSGFRIGYGGGYYDRYLFTYPMSQSVGLVFDEFLLDEVPKDEWDMALNYCITESRIYRFGIPFEFEAATVRSIKVLGTGCKKCKTLEQYVRLAVSQLGWDLEVEKVEELDQLIAYGLKSSPGLVINGKLVLSGKVPSIQELKDLLTSNEYFN
jgi:5-formyltetrahydrofolate cyclo-ligase